MARAFRITARIEGIKALQRKLRTEGPIWGAPWTKALGEATTIVEREARSRVPRGTGKLASSIKHKLQNKPVPMWARVTANASRRRVRYGFVLNWGQAMRRGKPVTFHSGGRATKGWFTGAMKTLQSRVNGILSKAAREIERAWGR